MKIFSRILLACGVIVAIGGAQNAFFIWDLSHLTSRIVEMTTLPLLRVESADRMAAAFHAADQQLADATDAIRFVSSSEATKEFRGSIAAIKKEIAALSSTTGSQESNRRIAGALQHVDKWAAEALVLIGEEPAASVVTPDELEADKSLIVRDLSGLVDDALNAAEDVKGDMLGLTELSQNRSILETIAALLVGFGLSLLVAFSITRPMGRLKRNMALVAGGYLQTTIQDVERHDELGSMSQALEVFRQQALSMRKLEQMENEARKREAALESARIADLERREASFQLLFVSNPVSMWVRDIETDGIIAVNEAAVRHYGYSREQFLSMRTFDIGLSNDNGATAAPFGGNVHRHRRADGAEIEVSIYENLLAYDGRSASLVAMIDLTERHRAERRIRHLVHHDALTELPNRSAFDEKLAAALRSGSDTSVTFALLCLDLDNFKEVNDVFGHAVGDKLLREIARRLESVADGAFIARIGGDEFTAISFDQNQPAAAIALAARLSAVVRDDIFIDGEQLRVGACIGGAIYPTDALDGARLFANADAALYRAKADGCAGVRFFEPEMDRRIRERHTLQHELRAALGRGEFALYYQPQATIGGEIFGFEALIRWLHPTRGYISPATFIPIAEESGLIADIGQWVLREACREAASWPNRLRVAVNLSPMQFRRGDLEGLLHETLLKSGLSPKRLELEITEGVIMQDSSRSLTILRQLKSMGVTIAMDDFGTGYSSLSYLQSFPFDKIKIDQSFIARVEGNEQSAAIVRAAIGLGRSLKMLVVAEGVETVGQLAFLSREDCDEVQGYLIGRPKPISDYAGIVGRSEKPQSFDIAPPSQQTGHRMK
jgi:diguanylate cyclase (GGDEF)-like protein/PAS domain S-box-containing protein